MTGQLQQQPPRSAMKEGSSSARSFARYSGSGHCSRELKRLEEDGKGEILSDDVDSNSDSSSSCSFCSEGEEEVEEEEEEVAGVEDEEEYDESSVYSDCSSLVSCDHHSTTKSGHRIQVRRRRFSTSSATSPVTNTGTTDDPYHCPVPMEEDEQEEADEEEDEDDDIYDEDYLMDTVEEEVCCSVDSESIAPEEESSRSVDSESIVPEEESSCSVDSESIAPATKQTGARTEEGDKGLRQSCHSYLNTHSSFNRYTGVPPSANSTMAASNKQKGEYPYPFPHNHISRYSSSALQSNMSLSRSCHVDANHCGHSSALPSQSLGGGRTSSTMAASNKQKGEYPFPRNHVSHYSSLPLQSNMSLSRSCHADANHCGHSSSLPSQSFGGGRTGSTMAASNKQKGEYPFPRNHVSHYSSLPLQSNKSLSRSCHVDANHCGHSSSLPSQSLGGRRTSSTMAASNKQKGEYPYPFPRNHISHYSSLPLQSNKSLSRSCHVDANHCGHSSSLPSQSLGGRRTSSTMAASNKQKGEYPFPRNHVSHYSSLPLQSNKSLSRSCHVDANRCGHSSSLPSQSSGGGRRSKSDHDPLHSNPTFRSTTSGTRKDQLPLPVHRHPPTPPAPSQLFKIQSSKYSAFSSIPPSSSSSSISPAIPSGPLAISSSASQSAQSVESNTGMADSSEPPFAPTKPGSTATTTKPPSDLFSSPILTPNSKEWDKTSNPSTLSSPGSLAWNHSGNMELPGIQLWLDDEHSTPRRDNVNGGDSKITREQKQPQDNLTIMEDKEAEEVAYDDGIDVMWKKSSTSSPLNTTISTKQSSLSSSSIDDSLTNRSRSCHRSLASSASSAGGGTVVTKTTVTVTTTLLLPPTELHPFPIPAQHHKKTTTVTTTTNGSSSSSAGVEKDEGIDGSSLHISSLRPTRTITKEVSTTKHPEDHRGVDEDNNDDEAAEALKMMMEHYCSATSFMTESTGLTLSTRSNTQDRTLGAAPVITEAAATPTLSVHEPAGGMVVQVHDQDDKNTSTGSTSSRNDIKTLDGTDNSSSSLAAISQAKRRESVSSATWDQQLKQHRQQREARHKPSLPLQREERSDSRQEEEVDDHDDGLVGLGPFLEQLPDDEELTIDSLEDDSQNEVLGAPIVEDSRTKSRRWSWKAHKARIASNGELSPKTLSNFISRRSSRSANSSYNSDEDDSNRDFSTNSEVSFAQSSNVSSMDRSPNQIIEDTIEESSSPCQETDKCWLKENTGNDETEKEPICPQASEQRPAAKEDSPHTPLRIKVDSFAQSSNVSSMDISPNQLIEDAIEDSSSPSQETDKCWLKENTGNDETEKEPICPQASELPPAAKEDSPHSPLRIKVDSFAQSSNVSSMNISPNQIIENAIEESSSSPQETDKCQLKENTGKDETEKEIICPQASELPPVAKEDSTPLRIKVDSSAKGPSSPQKAYPESQQNPSGVQEGTPHTPRRVEVFSSLKCPSSAPNRTVGSPMKDKALPRELNMVPTSPRRSLSSKNTGVAKCKGNGLSSNVKGIALCRARSEKWLVKSSNSRIKTNDTSGLAAKTQKEQKKMVFRKVSPSELQHSKESQVNTNKFTRIEIATIQSN